MAEEIVTLTSGLYRFMIGLEPLVTTQHRHSAEATEGLRQRAQTLLGEFTAARERAGERMAHTVDQISRSLRAMVSELGSESPIGERVATQWRQLGDQYETLLGHIRRVRLVVPKDLPLGHLKPRNLARNLFHVGMGVFGIGLYEFVLDRSLTMIVGGGLLALFVLLEILRRVSQHWNDRLYGGVFAPLSRPGEGQRVCTSTFYLSGLMIGVWLLPKHAIELGTLALAFGDPAASLVGKRWGRVKLWQDKSVAGTATFVVVSAVLCAAFVLWRLPEIEPWRVAALAAAVSVAGGLAELWGTPLNDNLTIPVVAGLAATALL